MSGFGTGGLGASSDLRSRMAATPSEPRLATAAAYAGATVRYAFYTVGAVVLALIGVGILTVWNAQVRPVDAAPSFRLASETLDRLQVSTHVETGGRIGRIEVRQYGQLHDRDTDLTVVMRLPPKGEVPTRDFAAEMRNIKPLRDARAVLTTTYYDLDTRFGPVRAADLRIDSDGRRKLCLAYLSRFETPAVYLKGWYCEASGAKPSIHRLACLIDKIVVDAPLAVPEADAFLRERMRRGATCSAAPVTQTTDTRTYVPRPRR